MNPAYTLTTESGTIYELSSGATHVRRLTGKSNTAESLPMRADATWLEAHAINGVIPTDFTLEVLTVGEPVTFILEPLDPAAAVTSRTTTPLVTVGESQ